MTEEQLAKRQAVNKAYYQRKKAEFAERGRKWRAANPARMKELNAEWYASHQAYAKQKKKEYRDANPERMQRLTRKWYLDNKKKTIGTQRHQRTGCSPEQYDELFARQFGLCAICQCPPGKHALAADHCHITQTVRGLLCGRCNRAIGLFKDSMTLLESAIAYLKKS